mmetsp:Transcript_21761/g.39246  ORF Transcript_21761/g.39246 Transcript_21761/m.39246 type:complete len:216 (-) Transcript_21761:26-673(-)
MLDLLKLLVRIFLCGVVDVEGVPSTRVSNADVSTDTVSSLFPDADDTLVLEPGHTGDDLVDGRLGDSCEGLEGVELRVGIDSTELIRSGEGSEESRPDESNNGELGNAAVGEFGLTEPLEITHEVSFNVKGVVELSEGSGGESDGVETNISDQGTVKGVGAGSERKSLCSLKELDIKGSSDLAAGLGRGESSGRASEEGKGSNLHHGGYWGYVER